MTIKLYGAAMSTCTARVLACLHETGAEFELVPVNMQNGEHKQPAFLAKNVTPPCFVYLLYIHFNDLALIMS